MKNKSTKMCDNAIVLRSYEALDQKLDILVRGKHVRSMAIVSSAGLQKSTSVERILPNAVFLSGRCTAYGLYQFCYANQNRDLVLDDCDRVDSSPETIATLKALTDTRRGTSTLSWNSATPEIRSGDLPSSFTTTSRLVILANQWKTLGADVQAVVDRCNYFIRFCPSNLEIHRRVAEFFHDQEVFDFIGNHLSYAANLSMRDYVKAAAAKADGDMDWQKDLLSRWLDSDDKRIVAELQLQSWLSPKEMVAEYIRLTGKSKAQYYRIRSELPEICESPQIILPKAQVLPLCNNSTNATRCSKDSERLSNSETMRRIETNQSNDLQDSKRLIIFK